MHIECPHCQNPIDLLVDQQIDSVTCPTCGSSISLFDPEKTATFEERELRAIGRFQLIERLGSGQFGDVWLAEDSTLEREVAIKVPRSRDLDRGDIERIMREARAAAQLQHPNIVRVHEIGKAGELIFIVSEVIRGANLRDWLADRPLKPDESAGLCATLADALHHAHEAGVVHRDMKPGNVLMDRDGQPHLTDFGLAKRDGAEITMTVDGRIMGTPAYMSPEQARGDAHAADRRSDVYSLGVMLFEMLTGERPFRGNSKMMLIQQVLTADPPYPRKVKKGIPRDLETICLKAMSKEPVRRYQTAREMAGDLRRYLAGTPITARPVSRLERAWRWSRRNPVVAAGSTIIMILACLFASLYASNQPLRHKVSITTQPPGANVVFIPFSPLTGEPRPENSARAGKSPVTIRLAPGNYLVIAYTDDMRRFHEVHRQIPGDTRQISQMFNHQFWKSSAPGMVELAPIKIPDEQVTLDMALIGEERHFLVGSSSNSSTPEHYRSVPSFYIDKTEISISQWTAGSRRIPDELKKAETPDSFPVTYVTWDQAIAFSEAVGKRLPNEFEYELAATAGGRHKYPWGNNEVVSSRLGPVSETTFDRLESDPSVIGLHSNAAEWTTSWRLPYPNAEVNHVIHRDVSDDSRIVRGGPQSTIDGTSTVLNEPHNPQSRVSYPRWAQSPGLGFRCVRSVRPSLSPRDFVSVVPSK